MSREERLKKIMMNNQELDKQREKLPELGAIAAPSYNRSINMYKYREVKRKYSDNVINMPLRRAHPLLANPNKVFVME